MPFLAPLVGVGAAAGGAAASFAALGQAFLSVGLSIGLSALAGTLSPSQTGENQPSGTSLQLQVGEKVARWGVFGRGGLAGQLVYWNLYGASNKFLQLVFKLSDGWCDGLDSVFVNGKLKTLVDIGVAQNEAARYHVTDFDNKIEVRFFDGRPGQLADPQLINQSNPSGRWTTTDVGTGQTYVSLTITFDANLFKNGDPQFLWVLRGLRLYDWRKDSTNGGSGSHRWNSPSTWQWSQNPALGRYTYQRGLFIGSERVLGQAIDPDDLILDLYTGAANACDETVTLADSSTEKRFRIAYVAKDDVEHLQNLAAFDEAMAGFGVERQGSFGPVAGVAQTVVDTITDADLVAGEDVEWSRKASRSEIANAIFGQYTDPSHDWQARSYPAILNSTYETEDGERIGRTLDLLMIPSVSQARRVARIRYNQNRVYQATGTITLGFDRTWYEAGDWLGWNSTLYGNRVYLITTRSIDKIGGRKVIRLGLKEIASAALDPGTGDDALAPTIAAAPATGSQASTVSNFQIAPTTIRKGSRVMPGLKFTWDPPDDPTITAVVIQYRQVGDADTEILRAVHLKPEDGIHKTANGVVGGADYESRATIDTTPFRTTTFTDPWVSTVTDDEAISGDDLDEQTKSEIALATNAVNGSYQQLRDRVEGIAADIAEAVALASVTGADQYAQILAQLSSIAGNLNARVAVIIEAISDSDQAQARALFDLKTSITDPVTGAISTAIAQFELHTLSNLTTQLAEAVTSLRTEMTSTSGFIAAASANTLNSAQSFADSAVATGIANYDAEVVQPSLTAKADVTALETAVADLDSAIATLTDQVSASFGSLSATAGISLRAKTTGLDAGVAAEIDLYVQKGTNTGGSLAFATGSTAVVGTGTLFSGNVKAGDTLKVTVAGVALTIGIVAADAPDNTHLTLVTPVGNDDGDHAINETANASYSIWHTGAGWPFASRLAYGGLSLKIDALGTVTADWDVTRFTVGGTGIFEIIGGQTFIKGVLIGAGTISAQTSQFNSGAVPGGVTGNNLLASYVEVEYQRVVLTVDAGNNVFIDSSELIIDNAGDPDHRYEMWLTRASGSHPTSGGTFSDIRYLRGIQANSGITPGTWTDGSGRPDSPGAGTFTWALVMRAYRLSGAPAFDWDIRNRFLKIVQIKK